MTDHPITPPLELVKQWSPSTAIDQATIKNWQVLATQSARWGADQELDACCEEMKSIPSPLGIPFGEMASNALRNARRPKSPSLKEQALSELDAWENMRTFNSVTIRRALETLPD